MRRSSCRLRCCATGLVAWLVLAALAAAPAARAYKWFDDADGGGEAAPPAARRQRAEGAEPGAEQLPWSKFDRLKLVSVNSSNVGQALYDVMRHE